MYKTAIRMAPNLVILMVISTVFVVNDYLINGIVSGKRFWFYGSMVLLSVVAIPAVIVRKERLSFKTPDLLILLFCIAAVLNTLNHSGRLTDKCLLLGLVTVLYFYLRIFLSNKNRFIYRLSCIFFIVTGLVETIWGLMQLYGFLDSQHHLFRITGSFFNPGPYSGWLAMVFPLALGYAIFEFKKNNHKRINGTQNLLVESHNIRHVPYYTEFIIYAMTVSCTLLILPAGMSRASWLAVIGGCTFIGITYSLQNKRIISYIKRHLKRVVLFSFVALVLLVASMIGLFLLKKDSASGRTFTWKISLQTIQKHPMGVGLGNFAGSYGDVQAAYFASGIGTEKEEYIAGGVEYAFNEYLQICIETGIILFLIFISFVVCILVIGIRNKNYLPTGSLVSLLIFASMSYPFNVLPFMIAFMFLSVLCMANNRNNDEKQKKEKPYPKFMVWLFLIMVPVSIVLTNFQFSTVNFQQYKAYKQWKEISILYDENKYPELVEEYAKKYTYLQDNLLFLFEYAHCLSKLKQYSKSNEILRRAMQISCEPMLYNIMGMNYQALKEYELARQSLKKAINLVPNRLYPHYLLAKLYHEMGLKDKMEQETNIVLTKPPKIESMAVKDMREELVELKTKR